ncbi:MAG: hypothetical protein GY765_42455, partial [bacterium]|nr:hypothetical protein [bacterium]
SRQWAGIVTRKSDFVQSDTQSISVFVDVKEDHENPLLPGLYLKAVFPGIVVQNSMEIQRSAVFNNNSVFIVSSGRLYKKAIQIKKINSKTLIFTGLEEGLELVCEPLVNAEVGTRVRILKDNVFAQMFYDIDEWRSFRILRFILFPSSFNFSEIMGKPHVVNGEG